MSFLDRLFGRKSPVGPASAPPAGPTDGRFSKEAAQRAIDALVLAHGVGWDRIELSFGQVNGRLAVIDTSVALRAQGDDPLDIDPAMAIAGVSSGFMNLEGALGIDGIHWDSRYAEATWVADVIRLALRSGATETVIEVDPSALVFGTDFHDAAHAIRAKVAERQAELDRVLGSYVGKSWDRTADPDHLVFRYADDRRLVGGAVLIGSYSSRSQSWCQAWANSSFAPELTAAMRRLSEDPTTPRALRAPAFDCPPTAGAIVASIAADRLGGLPTFRFEIPTSGVQLYFALSLPDAK